MRAEPVMPEPASSRRWLSIVGIGEDGVDGLSAVARGLVSGADIVFGGARHLALAAPLIRGEAKPWPSPFSRGVDEVLAARGRQGLRARLGRSVLLWRRLGAGEPRLARGDAGGAGAVVVQPGGGAARLGAARHRARLAAWPRARSHPPASASRRARAGAHLRQRRPRGAGAAVGRDGLRRVARSPCSKRSAAPSERIRTTTAASFDLDDIAELNVVAVEVEAAPGARIIAYTPGLADDLFEHDGQITKREIRAVTLSSLAPLRGELLWDIGAGSGSIAIEWMLAHPSLRAVAIEARADRADAHQAQRRCASACRSLKWSRATRPRRSSGLASPDAVFVGGGASEPGVLDAAIAALQARRTARRQCRDAGDRGSADRAARRARRHAHAHRHLARRQRGRQDRLAPGDAGDAMGVGEAMIVAGIGCRKGASAEEIERGIDDGAGTRRPAAGDARASWPPRTASASEAGHRGGRGGAAGSGSCFVDQADLEIACRARRDPGRGACWRLPGVPSVAEAAALAACGPQGAAHSPAHRRSGR